MGTLSCIHLQATDLLGILDKSFNLRLSFLICKAWGIKFCFLAGAQAERKCNCKNTAPCSDFNSFACALKLCK